LRLVHTGLFSPLPKRLGLQLADIAGCALVRSDHFSDNTVCGEERKSMVQRGKKYIF
jgi:hypothetical protein